MRGNDGHIRAAVMVLVEPLTDSRSPLTISVDFTGHGIGKLMVRREARNEMPEKHGRAQPKIEAA